jgi:hypothetical protein
MIKEELSKEELIKLVNKVQTVNHYKETLDYKSTVLKATFVSDQMEEVKEKFITALDEYLNYLDPIGFSIKKDLVGRLKGCKRDIEKLVVDSIVEKHKNENHKYDEIKLNDLSARLMQMALTVVQASDEKTIKELDNEAEELFSEAEVFANEYKIN